MLASLPHKLGDQWTSDDQNQCIKILVTQANRDVLTLLDDHLHGRTIKPEPITVWKLVQFAKKYQMEMLLAECFNYLQDNITLANCMTVFNEIQQTLGNKHATEARVHYFMKTNFRKVRTISVFISTQP